MVESRKERETGFHRNKRKLDAVVEDNLEAESLKPVLRALYSPVITWYTTVHFRKVKFNVTATTPAHRRDGD